MTYETKAGSVGGSITTVVPSALVNLLNIKKGSKIRWITDVSEKGVVVTVETVKEEFNKE